MPSIILKYPAHAAAEPREGVQRYADDPKEEA